MNLIQKKSKNAELNVEINSYFDNKQNMGFEKEQIVRKTVCSVRGFLSIKVVFTYVFFKNRIQTLGDITSTSSIKGHYRLFEYPQSNVFKIEAKKYFPYKVNKYM